LQQRIEAVRAGSGRREPQKDERVQRRLFAAVGDREEAARRPRAEVRHCHLAAQDERRRPCEQAEDQQRPADALEDAGDAADAQQVGFRPCAGEPDQLLETVLPEEQAGGDPDHEQRVRHER
jgi:alkanesulfonate monooxygenase SsuD/methylene tetrahydromethanopterin reductase-like flavin-dependent oxidoreductase (luciferase family)